MAKSDAVDELIFPLRTWVASERLKTSRRKELSFQSQLELQRACVLRKITVSFAIGKLLQHLKSSVSSFSQEEILRLCSIDNFAVRVATDATCDEGWEVAGIDMISPSLSLRLVSSLFDSSTFFESSGDAEHCGRDVDAVVTRHSSLCCSKQDSQDRTGDDSFLCYSLGVLLHFLFSAEFPLDTNPTSTFKEHFNRSLSISFDECANNMKDDPRQLTMKCEEGAMESSRPNKSICLASQHQTRFVCHSMSIPNVSRLVEDLLECESANDLFCRDDSILTLEAAINDLYLLLRNPQRYLVESSYPLRVCTKMYGRSSEAKALTDAFCRVASSGQSEAFVIRGFSGYVFVPLKVAF